HDAADLSSHRSRADAANEASDQDVSEQGDLEQGDLEKGDHPASVAPAEEDAGEVKSDQKLDTPSAIRWSAFSSYSVLAIRLLVSIGLARLLLPEAFGLYSMGYVLVGIAGKLKTMGFAAAIIQRPEINRRFLNAIFWSNLGLCSGIALLIALSAPFSASWFGQPVLLPLTWLLSLTLFGPGLTLVPMAMLQKQFAFNRLAVREVGEMTVIGVSTISAAAMGMGVWSLAIGEILGMAYRIIALYAVFPFKPGLDCDWGSMRETTKFGVHVTVARLVQHAATSMDVMAIGFVLGPIPLGLYAVASRYMRLPRDLVDRFANRVLFSVFCRDQGDAERIADTFLRARSAACLIVFPCLFGLAIVATPFVLGVLGPKWFDSIPVLQFLCVACAIESVGATNRKLLIATDRTGSLVKLSIVQAVVRGLFVFVGCQWDIRAVAIACLLSTLVTVPISLRYVFLAVPRLTAARLSRAVMHASLPTMVMSAAVLPLVLCFDTYGVPHLVTLFVAIVVASLVYLLALIWISPPGFQDMLRLLPKRARRIPILSLAFSGPASG
ncbi:MAG: lipopolysaccharide biosynthesis protein, partial [Planctomycetota bacterium]